MLERFFLKPMTVDRILGVLARIADRGVCHDPLRSGLFDAHNSSTGPDPRGVRILHRGFVRVTAGRQRVAQHAHPQATFKPRGRATRPMWQSVSACRLGG